MLKLHYLCHCCHYLSKRNSGNIVLVLKSFSCPNSMASLSFYIHPTGVIDPLIFFFLKKSFLDPESYWCVLLSSVAMFFTWCKSVWVGYVGVHVQSVRVAEVPTDLKPTAGRAEPLHDHVMLLTWISPDDHPQNLLATNQHQVCEVVFLLLCWVCTIEGVYKSFWVATSFFGCTQCC